MAHHVETPAAMRKRAHAGFNEMSQSKPAPKRARVGFGE